KLKEALETISEVKDRLAKISIPFLVEVETQLNLLSAYRPVAGMEGNFSYFKKALLHPERLQTLEALQSRFLEIDDSVYSPEILSIEQLEDKTTKIEAAITETDSFFKRTAWNLFSKSKREVFQILVQLNLEPAYHQLTEAS